MDSLRHPDLVAVGRSLRAAHDAVLAAEQDAARVAHRRTRSLRDLLLEAEDDGTEVAVHTALGVDRGRPEVGLDHVVVGTCAIALSAIVRVDGR